MNSNVSADIIQLIKANHYRPAVSIIIPFDPRMNTKTTLVRSLKLAASKVKKAMELQAAGELVDVVMYKLNTIINNLDYHTHHKSIAIFVSPVFERYYISIFHSRRE